MVEIMTGRFESWDAVNVASDLLSCPLYGFARVDALLRLPQGTARRWIDGYNRRDKHYPPVVRPETTGIDIVTWGEFVEAKLLSGYRSKGVAMLRMRPVVERLREQSGSLYPLATGHLFVANKELVARVQEEVGLDEPLRLVVVRTGQLAFSRVVEQFMDQVDWQTESEDGEEITARVLPLGKSSPVAIDPRRSFGEPVVGAVRTAVIAEEFRAGESLQAVADGFALSIREVNEAIRFELTRLEAD
jgi:uncharacterized protein (DUF433 family)